MEDTYQAISKEILKKNIITTREEMPFSLTPKDLEKYLPHKHTKINQMLRNYDYPEHDPNDSIPNRKIGGKRVIPRDWFLAWYYGEEVKKDQIIEEYEVLV